MFDPHNPTDLRRLDRAVKASHSKLEPHRKARYELVSDLIGKGYGEDPEQCEMPVNMLSLMTDALLMHLAGNTPQVLLPTARRDLLPFFADLEAIVNKELQVINFDKTMRRWVLEAIFSIGILKCGLVDQDYLEIIPGQPQPAQSYFADIVDFDDFVYDTDAQSWDRISFIGDRYKVDYDQIRDSAAFIDQGKSALKVNEEEFGESEERVSDMSADSASSDSRLEDSFRRTTWVWDICIPESGVVVTYPDAGKETVVSPLKVVEWDGVTNTPYHCLWFKEVPGNLMPLAPGQVVKSLNRLINALYRKLTNQAKRQKTLGLYRSGEEDNVKKIQQAGDGDLVPVSDPKEVTEVSFGGASQENLAFAIHSRDVFSQQAGNLDAMGGLGPQSETARQDAMLAQTVSKSLSRMSLAVIEATADVCRDFIYRIWNDPLNTYQTMRPISGTDVQVHAVLEPGVRQGSFWDFDVRIQPFSIRYISPEERAADILGLMTQFVIPIMPMLAEQGIGLNIQRLIEILSKYKSLPELQLIFEFIGPPMPGSGAEERPGKPASTHRTYERISRPGASRQGNSQTMQALMSGGNPQKSEVAALNRSASV